MNFLVQGITADHRVTLMRFSLFGLERTLQCFSLDRYDRVSDIYL